MIEDAPFVLSTRETLLDEPGGDRVFPAFSGTALTVDWSGLAVVFSLASLWVLEANVLLESVVAARLQVIMQWLRL